MTSIRQSSGRRDIGLAVVAVLAVAAASIAGQIATFPNLAPWYAGLAKPPFNPPNWLFAPAWAVLYLTIAVSGWLVWREAGFAGALLPLCIYAVQLALKASRVEKIPSSGCPAVA